MVKKIERVRNSGYASIDKDVDSIKYKLRLLEMDDLSSKIFTDENDYDYLAVEKLLTFADIPTYAKYSYMSSSKEKKGAYTEERIKDRVNKNILFYNTIDEMVSFEKKRKKEKRFFCQTKQGNIHLPKEFYTFLDKGEPYTYPYVRGQPRFIFDNDNYDIFLVRKALDEYFDFNKTNECIKKLRNKENFARDWKNLEPNDYQKIDLSTGGHGIGSESDTVFHKLRGNVYARDKLLIVSRKRKDNTGKYEVYIMFFRNPKFFQILGIGVKAYSKLLFRDDLDASKEESRSGQTKWRDMLAELEISGKDSDIVKCPITGMEVIYPKEATILRASHIKEYAKCRDEFGKVNVDEAYDVNNGLLVTADADALFDKHMITINPENGDIVYSKLISTDLKKQLDFNAKVDKSLLIASRLPYLQYHYDVFNNLESKRSISSTYNT